MTICWNFTKDKFIFIPTILNSHKKVLLKKKLLLGYVFKRIEKIQSWNWDKVFFISTDTSFLMKIIKIFIYFIKEITKIETSCIPKQ